MNNQNSPIPVKKSGRLRSLSARAKQTEKFSVPSPRLISSSRLKSAQYKGSRKIPVNDRSSKLIDFNRFRNKPISNLELFKNADKNSIYFNEVKYDSPKVKITASNSNSILIGDNKTFGRRVIIWFTPNSFLENEVDFDINNPISQNYHSNQFNIDEENGDLYWNKEAFEFGEVLGEGSFGQVLHATVKGDDGIILDAAVKVLTPNNDQEKEEVELECSVLKKLSHDNIVKYYGMCKPNDTQVWIVLEYCELGSIEKILRLWDSPLSEKQIAYLIRSICIGLEYLHKEKNMIHRDIKSGNIMVNKNGIVKIGDFGVVRAFKRRISTTYSVTGTPHWIAPEIWSENNNYNQLADIWSLGITAHEFAVGKPPNADVGPFGLFMRLQKNGAPRLPNETIYEDNVTWSPEFHDFIDKTLQLDPNDRWDTTRLLKHPFLRNASNPECIMGMLTFAATIQNKHRESIKDLNPEKKFNPLDDFFKSDTSEDDDTLPGGYDIYDMANTIRVNNTIRMEKSTEDEDKPAFLRHFDSSGTVRKLEKGDDKNDNSKSAIGKRKPAILSMFQN